MYQSENTDTRNPCYTGSMINLTLSIDEGVLRQARIRALEEDSSVNARVRDFLLAYASGEDTTDQQRSATERLILFAEGCPSGGGLDNRTWTREDLYER